MTILVSSNSKAHKIKVNIISPEWQRYEEINYINAKN